MTSVTAEKRLTVKGMTCSGCETRIESELIKLPGVAKVRASAAGATVDITYDPLKAKPAAFEKAIAALGYKVEASSAGAAQKPGYLKAAGILAVLLLLFLLGSRFGWFQVFNLFPLAQTDMAYGMLFVVGLLTSIHCVAMCGGINLSQSLKKTENQGRFAGVLPTLQYNLGRVISYTVIGGIVGAAGSVIQLSVAMRGAFQILAGVFMVLMGLHLSGLFPFLGRLIPRLPKSLGRKIAHEKKRSNSPLYVGLLNGLMPCGPLQAMQLYALSTGSALGGALSMLLFSLGTVPLMFALGALSSLLSRKFVRGMAMAGAALVVVMGLSMFQNGWALSGAGTAAAKNTPVGTVQSAKATPQAQGQETAKATPQPISLAQVQEISSKITRYGYPAITVKAGIPVKWTLSADKGALNGCNSALVIPEYNIQKALEVGDNIIEFTPERTGTFTYTCWMGMIRSTIQVVAN